MPFCTVQHAADIVEPGQTVHLTANGSHDVTTVTLTRSGTPDAPISFVGAPAASADKVTSELYVNSHTQPTLVLSGVHDVRVSALKINNGAADAVDVVGSSDITFDTTSVQRSSGTPDASAAFFVDGASSDVSLTRNLTRGGAGYGVHIASGERNVIVASSLFQNDRAGGVHATGVSGLRATGDSVLGNPCAPAVTVDGGTTGTLEDNAFWASVPSGDPVCDTTALVDVAADSTGGVHTDYNSLGLVAPRFAYTWGGADHATAADLAAAVPGQAVHDIDVTHSATTTAPPVEGSPLIDSGDAQAPGLAALDFSGNPRSTDDPNTSDTGNGDGATDMGAFESQSVLDPGASYAPQAAAGLAPFDFTVITAPTDSWGEAATARVDFGDGDGPQPPSSASARSTSPAPSTSMRR